MTMAMPDSTDVAALPPGYGQYLGYLDGEFPNAAELDARFPHAHIIALTVNGSRLDADGCDIEPGNVTALYDQALAETRPEIGRLRTALAMHAASRGEAQGTADFVAFLRDRDPSELAMLLVIALRDGAA